MLPICSEPLPSKKIKDIRGETFGRLTVESFSHIPNDKGKNAVWNCKCECGTSCKVSSSPLRAGNTKSCGCWQKELSRESIKKTHNKGKHLYLIQCGEYIKIGRANNVSLRLTQIKSMCPYGVELLEVFHNKGDIEHDLHQRFKSKHHTGEWFMLNTNDVCEIVNIGESTNDG